MRSHSLEATFHRKDTLAKHAIEYRKKEAEEVKARE